jgi:hypothetical protein
VGVVANIKGPQGSPGAPGTPGTVWYNGTGVPPDTLGTDGDYYLDDATGNVYQKAAGTWA